MRLLAGALGTGCLVLTVACGGSSATYMTDGGAQPGTTDAAVLGMGGSGGAGPLGGGSGGSPLGGGSGGSGGSSGTCAFPSCLQSIETTCAPSGACVEQQDGTGSTNRCWANGVKEISAVDIATLSATITLKKGSTVCAVFASDASQAAAGVFTIKNGSGQAIGTGTTDANGNTVITCTGGTPVTLSSDCEIGASSASSPSSCTAGTCTP